MRYRRAFSCAYTAAEAETEPITTEEKQKESTTETPTEEIKKESVSYTITEDTHTQTEKTIWIVKPDTQLSKTDFAEVKRKFATIQGYYSTFKLHLQYKWRIL
jgi:hypothetical protein